MRYTASIENKAGSVLTAHPLLTFGRRTLLSPGRGLHRSSYLRPQLTWTERS